MRDLIDLVAEAEAGEGIPDHVQPNNEKTYKLYKSVFDKKPGKLRTERKKGDRCKAVFDKGPKKGEEYYFDTVNAAFQYGVKFREAKDKPNSGNEPQYIKLVGTNKGTDLRAAGGKLENELELEYNGRFESVMTEDYVPEEQGYVKLGDGTFADAGMVVARRESPKEVAGEIESLLRDDCKPGAWQMVTLKGEAYGENPLNFVLHPSNKVPGLKPKPGTAAADGGLVERAEKDVRKVGGMTIDCIEFQPSYRDKAVYEVYFSGETIRNVRVERRAPDKWRIRIRGIGGQGPRHAEAASEADAKQQIMNLLGSGVLMEAAGGRLAEGADGYWHDQVRARNHDAVAAMAGRADWNEQDADGNTPLHIAAMTGWAKAVWLMTDGLNRPDPNIRNNAGQTALDLADDKETRRAVQALIDKNQHYEDERARMADYPGMKLVPFKHGKSLRPGYERTSQFWLTTGPDELLDKIHLARYRAAGKKDLWVMEMPGAQRVEFETGPSAKEALRVARARLRPSAPVMTDREMKQAFADVEFTESLTEEFYADAVLADGTHAGLLLPVAAKNSPAEFMGVVCQVYRNGGAAEIYVGDDDGNNVTGPYDPQDLVRHDDGLGHLLGESPYAIADRIIERAELDFERGSVSDPDYHEQGGRRQMDRKDRFAMFSQEGNLAMSRAFDEVMAMDLPPEEVWTALQGKMVDVDAMGFREVGDTAVGDAVITRLEAEPAYRDHIRAIVDADEDYESFRMYSKAGHDKVRELLDEIVYSEMPAAKVEKFAERRLKRLAKEHPEAADSVVLRTLILKLADEHGYEGLETDENLRRFYSDD